MAKKHRFSKTITNEERYKLLEQQSSEKGENKEVKPNQPQPDQANNRPNQARFNTPLGCNASFLFYRDKTMGEELHLKNIGEVLGIDRLDKSLHGIAYSDYFKILDCEHFTLKTTYPGLLIGVGYEHPAVEKDDFQLGFFFDHTTGIPVIPGSSVKGVLKKIFPDDKDSKIEEKLEYLNGILKSNSPDNYIINSDNCSIIKKRLFEAKTVYYDAYISSLPKDKKIFAQDYITPHRDKDGKYNPFMEPVPLRFLKIAPGVEFTFQFKFNFADFNKFELSQDQVLKLFKQILLDFKIGAKRNYGYGTFNISVI